MPYGTKDYHSKAGLARSARLSPERRREISQMAANARWTLKILKKGSLKRALGVDVDCYVLDNDDKTAVISQSGMAEAFGFNKGTNLIRFFDSDRMAPYVNAELRKKFEKPLIFQGASPTPDSPSPIIHGYDITYIIDYCLAVIKASDDHILLDRQEKVVQQAKALIIASAKVGIKNVVYALCGYDPVREATIADFRRYVREDAGEWAPLFPNELYEQWARIYQLPIYKCSNGFELRPWKFKYLTEDHIYWPIANTKGAVQEYITERRKQTQGFGKRLFQYLNEHGKTTTHKHIWHLIGIMEMIPDGEYKEYEKQVKKRFGSPPKE